MRAESDPGGTSWWIIEFIGDSCKWREPGQHVGLSRGNLKRTDDPCDHMSVTVLFYIMNSHFNQLYITRGLSPPTSPCPPRAGGRVQRPLGSQQHTARVDDRAAGLALGSWSLGREWAQGRQLCPGPERGQCSQPRWQCGKRARCPRVPTETAGRACSVTRSLLQSIQWSEWQEHSYQWGRGGRGWAAPSPACAGASQNDRPRRPARPAVLGPGAQTGHLPVSRSPHPSEGRNVTTPCLIGGRGGRLLLGPQPRPAHGLPGDVTAPDRPEPNRPQNRAHASPKGHPAPHGSSPCDIGTSLSGRTAWLLRERPRGIAARRHQGSVERAWSRCSCPFGHAHRPQGLRLKI